MATWTKAGETWNTTAGNKTVVATPAANDLIVVVAGASGMAGADDISSVTDDNSDGLGTYTRLDTSTGGGTQGMLTVYVRDALVGSATSTTFTATISGDTGGGLTVMRLAGMAASNVGASSYVQVKAQSNQTSNPPSLTFDAATDTANAILLAVFCEDNPAALTPPSGFTEHTDTGYATPTSGIEVCAVNSGQTDSTYTWSGGAVTDHNDMGVEFSVSEFIPRIHGAAARQQLVQTSGMIGLLRK